MSVLGGHDAVFQIRRDKLLDLLQENLTVQGNLLQPPFRLSLPAPPAEQNSRPQRLLDLTVKSVNLTLQPGTNFCDLKLGLDGIVRISGAEAVIHNGELVVRIELLDGTLLFARPKQATLNVPPTAATAAIANFAALANALANKLINAERDKDVILFPQEIPGDKPGATKPNPVVAAFLIFGKTRVIDASTVCTFVGGEAQPGSLTSSLDGKRSFTLAFSAEKMKRFLFCRAILKPSERDPEIVSNFAEPSESERQKLPPPCGDGELSRGEEDFDLQINRLDFTFGDGHIDVNGSFHANNGCWKTRNGTFKQRIVLDFAGGMIIPRRDPPEPDVHVEIIVKWYCAILLEAVSFAIGGSVSDVVNAFLPSLAAGGAALGPQVPVTIAPVTWTGVTVSTEGLMLSGDRFGGGLVPNVMQPAVHLRTEHLPGNLQALGSGPFTVQAVSCPPATFQYVQSAQDDGYILSVDTEWLVEPLDFAWTVNGQLLAPHTKGDLDYIGVVKTAIPPPSGTAIPGHTIRLTYQTGSPIQTIARTPDYSLALDARKQDLNYDIRVEVRVTDALGRAFTDAINLQMQGDLATFDGDYYDYINHCLKGATDLINKRAKWKAKGRPGEPQEHFKDVLDIMVQQIHDGDAAAAALLPSLISAYGAVIVNQAIAGKLKR